MGAAVTYRERVAAAMRTSALVARLDAVRANGGFSPATIDSFAEHLETAPEDQLFRMSPLRYAAQKTISEADAINLFLHATYVGILDFNWGVVCSGCGSFLTTASSLKTLHVNHHCTICRSDVSVSIDDNIEVAFTVAPTVRRIRFHEPGKLDLRSDAIPYYFSSSLRLGPRFTDTIERATLERFEVLPGKVATCVSELEPGPYSLTILSHHLNGHVEASSVGGANSTLVELTDTKLVPATLTVRAGRVELHIRNRTPRVAHGALMRDVPTVWGEQYGSAEPDMQLLPFLTGKRLVTTQVFRDLFRTESVPADAGLEFKNLTVLFTDLKGSTEMYRRIGDFKAYAVVRDHFALLKNIVASSSGALVKTIGDAIMASFAEPYQALEAATAMHQQIKRVSGGQDLMLKIGAHAGPCIGVELNDRLDYFGQTVNVAARVQNVAQGNEIVCSPAVYGAPRVRDTISAANLRVTRDHVPLKGVTESFEVFRLR